ncbi:ribbon-helix-helix protein, CopG family [Sphingomonas sp. MMS24-JH45]
MARILADLPEDDVKWLDERAAALGRSRASVLREAVSAYRAEAPKDWLDAGFGAWKDRVDIGDADRVAAARTRVVDPPVGRRLRRGQGGVSRPLRRRRGRSAASDLPRYGRRQVSRAADVRRLVASYTFDSNILIDALIRIRCRARRDRCRLGQR